ncbi:MAG: STAS domain-containing protein [Chlorobium sp.]|uniref:STAS domain-containing protein n=1 Tax=Chlorobium sp. TaxID=1095 RepID=UPI002F3E9205
MTITETLSSGITIVELCGTIDASTAPELQRHQAISDPTQTIVIDLARLDFLDSSGLGAIIGAARRKEESGANMLLSCMNQKVRRVFDITGTVRLFHIFDETAAAIDYATTLRKSQ